MNGRVLIVDDDRDMCRLLAADLAHRGFEVTWRTSADAALEAVGTAEVDAVVTDVNKPVSKRRGTSKSEKPGATSRLGKADAGW